METGAKKQYLPQKGELARDWAEQNVAWEHGIRNKISSRVQMSASPRPKEPGDKNANESTDNPWNTEHVSLIQGADFTYRSKQLQIDLVFFLFHTTDLQS
jgi:hypothetical protein